MPLVKTCSIDALERNIAAEIRAGKPREQAVAIAQRTLRESCRGAGKPVPTRKAYDVIAGQPTVGVKQLGGEDPAGWMQKNDVRLELDECFEPGGINVGMEDGLTALVAKRKPAKRRKRTPEFLEGALERARKVMNPRDFAVIFQAARASAGGQISARNRKERMTAGERQLIDKASLTDMSKAELSDMSRALNKAYRSASKSGGDLQRVLSRAESLRQEYRRRELGDPDGPVYVELAKRGKKDVRKGFITKEPDGGMHAHGLDRPHTKTLMDGGHLHIWQIPGSAEIVISYEDGAHAHAIADPGDNTDTDGAHSHKVLMPNGGMLETTLAGEHVHQLMVETSGFDGLHKHALVMPDGTEVQSMTPAEFVAMRDRAPTAHPLPYASDISRAMKELQYVRLEQDLGGELPCLPTLEQAVMMTAKGESIAPPLFTMEVIEAGDYPGFGAEPGDMMEVRGDGEVVGFSKHVVADAPEDVREICTHWELLQKHTTPVPFVGPKDAKLLFISAAPNDLELARKQALVGEDAMTFEKLYLAPLGMAKRDVAVGFAMPVVPHGDGLNSAMCEKWAPHLVDAMTTYSGARVVALGKAAREVLAGAGVECWSMPHPSAVRKRGDRGEVARKLKAIAKALDVPSPTRDNTGDRGSGPSKGSAPGKLADAISEMRKTGRTTCRVIKSADEKQIVYGAVLDPYEVDLQSEWVPPAEIESSAHGFLKKSRVIGFEHVERAEGQIVESWIEPYPSRQDYQAALENRPHRAYTRKFGDDVIHSGTWVAGVQLGDHEWALHKQGKLNAFSVGGFSFKSKVTTAVMPEVDFIELIEAPV